MDPKFDRHFVVICHTYIWRNFLPGHFVFPLLTVKVALRDPRIGMER